MRARVAPDQVPDRVRQDLGEGLGHADGQRDAERVPQTAGVLDGRPLLGTRGVDATDADGDHAPCRRELVEPGRHVVAHLGAHALRELRGGQRPVPADRVRELLERRRLALGCASGELGLGLQDRARVQQVGERGLPGLAQQLREQRRVERERGGTAFRERCVPVVQELRRVPEQQ